MRFHKWLQALNRYPALLRKGVYIFIQKICKDQNSFLKFLFIHFGLYWVFSAVRAFSSCCKRDRLFIAVLGPLTVLTHLVTEHGLQGAQASVVAACGLNSCSLWALEHKLSSCGPQASLLCDPWDLRRPGFDLVSLGLAGGFLTTELSGMPRIKILKEKYWQGYEKKALSTFFLGVETGTIRLKGNLTSLSICQRRPIALALEDSIKDTQVASFTLSKAGSR